MIMDLLPRSAISLLHHFPFTRRLSSSSVHVPPPLPPLLLVLLLLLLPQQPCSASHRQSYYDSAASRFLSSTNLSAPLPQPQPYRTAFHFQPARNWMNDPNGPLFYKGYYHLFYQWNPYAAVWGNITWGHAVSEDMVNWRILEELALVPGEWYDEYGCWSGSATMVRRLEGELQPVMVYTGWSNASASRDNQVQMQAMAVPTDAADPLLRRWTKIAQNPVIRAPPPGINSTKFRDPTTAWTGPDGRWRLLVGAKKKHRGLALLYESSDFVHWEVAKHPLHSVGLTGMWECPDFYPVPADASPRGLDMDSVYSPSSKLVLKVSLDDTKHDHYVVGSLDPSLPYDSFVPSFPALDAGLGLRYDYGKFYASKTFFDTNKSRRILWGWVNESSSEAADIAKGWSSLQAVPRVVRLDPQEHHRLLQWPIQEIEGLRRKKVSLGGTHLDLEKGSVFKVDGIVNGDQLDVNVRFRVPKLIDAAEKLDYRLNDSSAQSICSEVGKTRNGTLGPFGLLVLASDNRTEQTAIFFYVVSTDEGWKALICSDQSRSSLATDVDKTSYGSFVSIGNTDRELSLRVLVDHSIVESFGQGGKVCITARVYPTTAIGGDAHLFVFNSGKVPVRIPRLEAWQMDPAHIQ